MANLNYESANGTFPAGRGSGIRPGVNPSSAVFPRDYFVQWGHLSLILPYVEAGNSFNQIDYTQPTQNSPVKFHSFAFFLCPTDPEDRQNNDTCSAGGNWKDAGRTSYFGNGGAMPGETPPNQPSPIQEENNGIFLTNIPTKMSQVTDGTSHDGLLAERVRGDGDKQLVEESSDWFRISGTGQNTQQIYTSCSNANVSALTGNLQYPCGGRNWIHGDYGTSRYNHIMPPNSRSCTQSSSNMTAIPVNENGGATTASSNHPGGVNTVLADGSTHFVADNINYLVWNAVGSRDGQEVVDNPF